MNALKHIFRTSLAVFLTVSILGACKKNEGKKDLGPAPTSDQVKFTVTPSSDNANVIGLKSESPGFKAIWDFGNGTSAEGNVATASYPLAGTYTIKLTIVTDGGIATNSKSVTIANTNPSMLKDPAFALLSGGLTNAAGKTWVIDKMKPGHLGVGPSTSAGPDWYQAGPDEKAGLGFYDDEMNFNMSGGALKYTYVNNGTTFANGANAAGIGGPASGPDLAVSYTPPTNMTWLVTETDGTKYITLSNNGFIAYYLGVSKYQMISLTEDEMYLRCLDKANAGNAWYLKLIRKGFVR